MSWARSGVRQKRFILGVAFIFSFSLAFGCAPKKVKVYESLSASEARDKIVTYALTLLGKPYKGGAKGPDSFDCSGFVYYVYKRFDIVVPVSTEGLNKTGSEISRESVTAADLVLFKIKRDYHVGIMMNGAEFIHASKSKGVAVDSLDFKYWRRNLDHFRRIM